MVHPLTMSESERVFYMLQKIINRLKNFPVMLSGVRPLLCICISILCAATIISALPTAGEEALYDRVIRLHVLANSDTEEDQALKLTVRDAVLTYLNDTSAASTCADDAEAQYQKLLPQIEQIAEETVRAAGYSYDCRVTLTREAYPERSYKSITLPAGTYRSLRVQIGEAAGHNWWCVLFPPLCLSLAVDAEPSKTNTVAVYEDQASANKNNTGTSETAENTAEEDTLLAVGFTPYEVSLISGNHEQRGKTVVKFRIVEFFRTLFAK